MHYYTTTFDNWDKVLEHFQKYNDQWIFRGQREACWILKNKIERLQEQFDITPDDLVNFEWRALREFRRRYHLYAYHTPDWQNYVEWLSIMQHHGAPTRLLDFTYSWAVACYFALENATGDCAVWAINAQRLRDKARYVIKDDNKALSFDQFSKHRDGSSFRKLFCTEPLICFVRVVNPIRLNQRLTVQQGCFLCPGNIKKSFVTNLCALDSGSALGIKKVVLRRSCVKEGLRMLRKMNVDRTSLFPGIDGFAQSLNTQFPELGEMYAADKSWRE